jgi:hypothetical protein
MVSQYHSLSATIKRTIYCLLIDTYETQSGKHETLVATTSFKIDSSDLAKWAKDVTSGAIARVMLCNSANLERKHGPHDYGPGGSLGFGGPARWVRYPFVGSEFGPLALGQSS